MVKQKKYRWVLFDADETLFAFRSYQGLKNVLARYNVPFSLDDYARYQQINQPMWLAYQNQEIDVYTLKTARFQTLAKQTGRSPLQLNDELMQEMIHLSPALSGTLPTLQGLHGKVKMGVITNGFTLMQQPRLEVTDTAKFFDLLVISEEVGVSKPSSGIFANAFAQMQKAEPKPLHKADILMVGDSLTSDILGGNNFGIDTCWFNPKQVENATEIKPTFEINALEELLTIV